MDTPKQFYAFVVMNSSAPTFFLSPNNIWREGMVGIGTFFSEDEAREGLRKWLLDHIANTVTLLKLLPESKVT